MYALFPAITPYATHYLAVSDIYRLYIEECGNPEGLPILILHGGPGFGCRENDRCFCDPEVYRIILFDQRGSRRSLPHGALEDNNTQELILDIEKIRSFLKIKNWVVLGSSFGSLLALLYAESYPNPVLALILRSIFLNSAEHYHWSLHHGLPQVFPDYWQQFIETIPAREHHNILDAFYQRLSSSDEIARMSAAKAWATFRAQCATLDPNPHLLELFLEPSSVLSYAKIAAHFFCNYCFLEKEQVENNIHKIEHIQTIIIHARYDMISPVINAFKLHTLLPHSQLQIIRDAGHAGIEAPMIDSTIRATIAIGEDLSAA